MGIDLLVGKPPRVRSVAILRRTRKRYLRSATSLIQTAVPGGARQVDDGEVTRDNTKHPKFLAVSEYQPRNWPGGRSPAPRSVSRAVEQLLAVYQSAAAPGRAALERGGGNFDVTETLRELQNKMVEASTIWNLKRQRSAANLRIAK